MAIFEKLFTGKTVGDIDMTRRDFLNLASASMTFLKIPHLERPIAKELIDIGSNSLIVDFVKDENSQNDLQSLLNAIPSADSVPPGTEIPYLLSYLLEQKDKLAEFSRNDPLLKMIFSNLAYYSDHGEQVADNYSLCLQELGFKGNPVLLPLQNFLKNISLDKDGDENMVISGEIDADLLTAELAKYPDQKIINLSWLFGKINLKIVQYERDISHLTIGRQAKVRQYQIGNNSLYAVALDNVTFRDFAKPVMNFNGQYYIEDNRGFRHKLGATPEIAEENEYERLKKLVPLKKRQEAKLEIIESYSSETAAESLEPLIKLCGKFSDKLFVAAAGNAGSDIRRVRKIYGNKWPDNLLLTAEWKPRFKDVLKNADLINKVYGADVYEKSSDVHAGYGTGSSSRTTADFTAMAAILSHFPSKFPPGLLKPAYIRKTLMELYCSPISYIVRGPLDMVQAYDEPAGLLKWYEVYYFFQLLHQKLTQDKQNAKRIP
ncbi:MAG: hypothetical protein UV73_C0005G0111 [Candidatus Gottesmanbacteria bacterium GW2011_GWA2_43_14]|uniref:Uncharacterized protein n=1 Tax=Candidatus Gottesmanbacteria bacterium GW2011_GWA2_43_14 TaxID=1618443 RepID=A0A0G1DJH9_9BACT|nr:MAG: hypothetical protein UV73_C0005G0111 [Candidatus Gottesmanbacteria bacterium GW2011_GWA2_43_14]